MEGKPLVSRDGGLNQDKQERIRKHFNRKIKRGFELYTIYFFEDNYIEWQTSHPPLACPTRNKKLENAENAPLTPLPLQEKLGMQ